MVEDTYTSEWAEFILRIFIINGSNPMWDTLIQRTHIKIHTDLSHISNLFMMIIFSKWINDIVLKILFELPILLLESIKIVEEVK